MTNRGETTVLLTGVSGGLGMAIGEAFAAQGSRVVIAARNVERLRATADKMARNGFQMLAFPRDVSCLAEVEALAREIQARCAVQVLVNNAGIARAVNLVDTPDELWDETLKTNRTGAFYCCKVFLPPMLRAGWGRIIDIGSPAARAGFRHAGAYSASKHGLLGLRRSLALETARAGVMVNRICPGYLDDERTRENARIKAEKTGRSIDEILRTFAASARRARSRFPRSRSGKRHGTAVLRRAPAAYLQRHGGDSENHHRAEAQNQAYAASSRFFGRKHGFRVVGGVGRSARSGVGVCREGNRADGGQG